MEGKRKGGEEKTRRKGKRKSPRASLFTAISLDQHTHRARTHRHKTKQFPAWPSDLASLREFVHYTLYPSKPGEGSKSARTLRFHRYSNLGLQIGCIGVCLGSHFGINLEALEPRGKNRCARLQSRQFALPIHLPRGGAGH